LFAAALMLTGAIAVQPAAQTPVAAQTPPATAPTAPPQGRGGQGRGGGRGVFPAQQRPPADPALVERGKALYEINCRACHGPDLRGGDMGGPNLLRSQLALNDQEGELITPVIQKGRQNPGMPIMPPLPLSDADGAAVAAYIHSVQASARGQGAPPPGAPVELNILVGDAAAGQQYFQANCSSCHSATGDLAGIATRASDPMQLQNLWVGGGGGRGRGGRGGGAGITATVTDASGQKVTGAVVHIDDFLIVLRTEDGQTRSFRRTGDQPTVAVNDPLAGHKKLWLSLTDKDMHDVTAYLVTLK
jgi:cytochrome c oxidase cbb3-type subunit III